MSKLLSIATDIDKNENGKWFPYPSSEIEFLIARAGNKKHSAFLKEAKGGEDRKGWEAFVDILLDWKNVDDEAGKSIKFNKTQLKKMAEDERYVSVFTWITNVALSEENYRLEAIEEMGE